MIPSLALGILIATVKLSVVPVSGTEGLRSIKDEGRFAVGDEPLYNMTLEYGFE